MSGGAYEYLYSKVDIAIEQMYDAQCETYEPYREKAMDISRLYSKLMKTIEWVDSGDKSPEDAELAIQYFLKGLDDNIRYSNYDQNKLSPPK
jgi:hypothetical protein